MGVFMVFFIILLGIFALFYVLSYWSHGRTVYVTSSVSLDGKTALITGGSTGIGHEVALDLARRGATVILTSRDRERGGRAVSYIRNMTGNQQVFCLPLNLGDLESVKQFASTILSTQPRLDLLINNAAISCSNEEHTLDGYDSVFTVNYLGHFLLTYLLLDLLKTSAPSRIVNVSSVAHTFVPKQFKLSASEDKIKTDIYSSLSGYEFSKLGLILHVKELAKQLAGSGVSANAAYPGVCMTQLWNQSGKNWPRMMAVMSRTLMWPIAQKPQAAAQTILYCAVAPEVEGISGKYYAKCSIVKESQLARDSELAKTLWEASLTLTGLRFDGKTVNLLPEYRYENEEEMLERHLLRESREKSKVRICEAPEPSKDITRS